MILNGTTFAIWQRPAFRKDINIVSSAFDRLAHDLLCFTPSVERCSIDPVHSLVHGGAYRLNGRFLVLWSPPDPPFRGRANGSGSYSDFGNLETALAKTSSLDLQSRSTGARLKTTISTLNQSSKLRPGYPEY